MAELKVILVRIKDDGKQTLGTLLVYRDIFELFKCVTLEPSWKDNQKNVSCVPIGDYILEPFNSPAHGECLLVKGIPGRSMIEIHAGNFIADTKGCILVGRDINDINMDGIMDLTYSKGTLMTLLQFVRTSAKMAIRNSW